MQEATQEWKASDDTAQNAALAAARSGVMNQLARNPGLQQTLFNFANAEAGGQGPLATQAYMESVIDRAAARYNGDISRAMGRDYHPGRTMALGRTGRASGPAGPAMLNAIARGSNVANFATGNASRGVGFAGGPQTAVYGPPRQAEGFGVEGPELAWARSVGYWGPASTSRGQMIAARGPTAPRGPTTGQPGPFRGGTQIAGLQGTPGVTAAAPTQAAPVNTLALRRWSVRRRQNRSGDSSIRSADCTCCGRCKPCRR
jgi:hypothetical protein